MLSKFSHTFPRFPLSLVSKSKGSMGSYKTSHLGGPEHNLSKTRGASECVDERIQERDKYLSAVLQGRNYEAKGEN